MFKVQFPIFKLEKSLGKVQEELLSKCDAFCLFHSSFVDSFYPRKSEIVLSSSSEIF